MAEPASGELANQAASPSYFVRLGKLSTKVQERAREQSLARARQARDVTYAAVAQITSTLDLLERARSSASTQIGEATEQLQQRWTEWKQKQAGAGDAEAEADGAKNEAEVSADAVGEFRAVRYAITFRMWQGRNRLVGHPRFNIFSFEMPPKKAVRSNYNTEVKL